MVIGFAGLLLLLFLVGSWLTSGPSGEDQIDRESVDTCVQQQQHSSGNVDLCY